MGSVLVGARFTETTDGISYASLIILQISSYPTLIKASFTQCNDLGPFLRRQIRTCTHDEMMVCTETGFKGGVYLYAVGRHSNCFQNEILDDSCRFAKQNYSHL